MLNCTKCGGNNIVYQHTEVVAINKTFYVDKKGNINWENYAITNSVVDVLFKKYVCNDCGYEELSNSK